MLVGPETRFAKVKSLIGSREDDQGSFSDQYAYHPVDSYLLRKGIPDDQMIS